MTEKLRKRKRKRKRKKGFHASKQGI